MVWNLILYRMVLPQMEKWKEHVWGSRRKLGEDSIHEDPHILPPNIAYILIRSSQLCGVWKIIGTSAKCIYGVICVCFSPWMHVFGWSFQNTFWASRMNVRITCKISNLFFRYLGNRDLNWVQKVGMSIMHKGSKRGAKDKKHMKKGVLVLS